MRFEPTAKRESPVDVELKPSYGLHRKRIQTTQKGSVITSHIASGLDIGEVLNPCVQNIVCLIASTGYKPAEQRNVGVRKCRYLRVICERCSNALNILDRFHIVAKMNDALNDVRSAEARTLVADGYQRLDLTVRRLQIEVGLSVHGGFALASRVDRAVRLYRNDSVISLAFRFVQLTCENSFAVTGQAPAC